MARKPTYEDLEQRVKDLERVEAERKQANEALQRHREELQIILDSVPAMVFFKDKENRYLRVNRVHAQTMGLAKEDLEGISLFDLSPELAADYWEDDKKVMKSGQPKRGIIQLIETSKGRRWHVTDKIPCRDEKGDINGVIGFAVDIDERVKAEEALQKTYDELERRVEERTVELLGVNEQLNKEIDERKHMEEALRQSEEHFRHAFDNANTGVSLVSPDGHFMRVNNRLCEIFGYSKEELEAMTVNEIAHPEDVELTPEFFHRSISGEIENTIYEKRYIHKQGYLVWGEVSSSIIRDPNSDYLYFISHVHDITQQKFAQQALEESQQKFSKLFQASPIYTCVTMLEDGRFLEVNEAFMKITGYRREEVIGRTTAEVGLFVNPKERSKFVKLAKEQGRFRDQEVNLQKKNGESLIMLWSAEKIEIGDKDCLISAIVNVTEIKKTEESLRESEGKLKIKANKLEEINTALKVLLDKRDEDKVRLQEDILSNVKQLVEPYLENLKRSKLNSIQKSYLDILESNLKEIISPLIRALSSSYLNFTPTEIKIANLVRHGKSSKEIAELINSTKCAVDFHRNSIRKKLDIKHKKLNLRTQLLSISNQSPKYDQY